MSSLKSTINVPSTIITLNFDAITVVPQSRQEFEKVELVRIADSIARTGLINEMDVLRFKKEEFKKYVRTISRLWIGRFSKTALKKLIINAKKTNIVLVAGQRRLESIYLLYNEGCTDCKTKSLEEGRNLLAGECFFNHFSSKKLDVKLLKNMSFEKAIQIQIEENIHEKLKPWEEAQNLRELFMFKKQEQKRLGQNLTIATFAKNIKRSPETIKKAIFYCELPFKIKKLVEERKISYGIAIELHRLFEDKMDENGLLRWVLESKIRREKPEDLKVRINSYFASKQQLSLVDMMNVNQISFSDSLKNRLHFDTMRLSRDWTNYFKNLIEIFEIYNEGRKNKATKFSIGGQIDLFEDIVSLLPKILTMVSSDLSNVKFSQISENIFETEKILNRKLLDSVKKLKSSNA